LWFADSVDKSQAAVTPNYDSTKVYFAYFATDSAKIASAVFHYFTRAGIPSFALHTSMTK
jgi:hypothetical protein